MVPGKLCGGWSGSANFGIGDGPELTSPRKTTATQNESKLRFSGPPGKGGTDEALEVLRRAGGLRPAPGREWHAGGDVCRQLGVSEATFYAWKKKYAHLGVSELRRLRQLEDENAG